MMGDPFEAADRRMEWFVAELDAAVLRAWNMKPCEFCGFTYVHRHDCLDRMNKVRTPTGDWWKL